MSIENLTLEYANDDDRLYGLAGMAISAAALDAIDKVALISIDADGPMVTFSHEYYFCGSPSISPKATWHNLLSNFHLTTAMVISNVFARSLVRLGHDAPADVMESLRQAVVTDGREICALEDDEVDSIYRRTATGMRRIFANPRLHPAIDSFARSIARRRTLSGGEIFDELRALHIL